MAIRIENVSQNKKEAPLLETIAILSSALSYSDLSSDSPLMEEEREGSEIVSNKSVNITTNRENFNEKRISPLNFWNSDCLILDENGYSKKQEKFDTDVRQSHQRSKVRFDFEDDSRLDKHLHSGFKPQASKTKKFGNLSSEFDPLCARLRYNLQQKQYPSNEQQSNVSKLSPTIIPLVSHESSKSIHVIDTDRLESEIDQLLYGSKSLNEISSEEVVVSNQNHSADLDSSIHNLEISLTINIPDMKPIRIDDENHQHNLDRLLKQHLNTEKLIDILAYETNLESENNENSKRTTASPNRKMINCTRNRKRQDEVYSLLSDPIKGPSINKLMNKLSKSWSLIEKECEKYKQINDFILANLKHGSFNEDFYEHSNRSSCSSNRSRSLVENHIYEEILYECLQKQIYEISFKNHLNE
ncbi:hypothetical protein SSS_08912 [Sarcoptes scabiei]|uniref:Uncharacterized protein n=1 Tax=Sarcoptes scabiei TaxID=52283 RepID=A0A834VI90_SARSC|nr:hypothetical protein SSS_08912 [Sarcoptes scabiei]